MQNGKITGVIKRSVLDGLGNSFDFYLVLKIGGEVEGVQVGQDVNEKANEVFLSSNLVELEL